MYRLEREDFVKPSYLYLWSLLGFQAGFVNAYGFLACARYVSHVTGFGTQMGTAIAGRDFVLAFEMFCFPLTFILGSFFNAVLTSARIERNKRPLYRLSILILPIGFASLAILGHFGVFGIFGSTTIQSHDMVLLFLLSFMCGLQNGCFATLTKGQIRTTHLTGISTDIGTDLARTFFGKLNPAEKGLTQNMNYCRISTFLCFAFGSVASVLISGAVGYLALLVPAGTAAYTYYSIASTQRLLDVRFRRQSSLEQRASSTYAKN